MKVLTQQELFLGRASIPFKHYGPVLLRISAPLCLFEQTFWLQGQLQENVEFYLALS